MIFYGFYRLTHRRLQNGDLNVERRNLILAAILINIWSVLKHETVLLPSQKSAYYWQKNDERESEKVFCRHPLKSESAIDSECRCSMQYGWWSHVGIWERYNFSPKSLCKGRNHMDSCAASDKAKFSASIVEVITHRCFLLVHATAAPLRRNTKPLVDLSDLSLANSAVIFDGGCTIGASVRKRLYRSGTGQLF